MTRISFVILVFSGLVHVNAQEIRTLSRARNVYQHLDCEKTDSCGLVRVSFLKEDYEVLVQNKPHLATRLIAEYETTDIESLVDYVFVQFIKGCVYETYRHEDGIGARYRISYGFTGEQFNFSNWRVDTYDDDPVYTSREPYGRHGVARWSELEGSFQTEQSFFYFAQKPPRPILYMQDYPSTAFVADNAQNVSLRFRTCLYRSEDVPLRVDPHKALESEPLICYEWESYFVYDHEKSQYDWPRNHQDVCPAGDFKE